MQIARFSILGVKEPRMSKPYLLLACLMAACASGCEDKPGSVQQAAQNKPAKVADPADADEPPPHSEPPLEEMPEAADARVEKDGVEKDGTEKDAAAEPTVLTLEDTGATFMLPAGWKRVKPETNIVEAEFELPRAEGDEYDGRLTLMSSGGDMAEIMAARKSEFKFDGEPPVEEKIEVSGTESTLLDLRGEWKGPSFRPIDPRADYRMLLVIVPFSERSAFYAKLTGPRATVAAHEDEFREFLKSAKIKR